MEFKILYEWNLLICRVILISPRAWLFALLLFDNNIKEGRHDSWEGLECEGFEKENERKSEIYWNLVFI